jgi:cell division protein FtsL
MNGEEKANVLIILIIALVICHISVCIIFYNIKTTELLFQNGYEEVMLVGSGEKKWQKVRGEIIS